MALDSLRQIAAIVVLLHHFFIVFEIDEPVFLSTGLFDAKAAVILFFVLSGFVLTLSLQREAPSVRSYVNFGIRRILRLYPLHFAATLLAFVILTWITASGGPAILLAEPIGYFQSPELNIRQWLLQLTLVMPGMDANYANPPVWTLMTEAKVAIVFPVISWTIMRVSLRSAFTLVAILILGCDWFEENLVGTIALLGHFGLGSLIARIDLCSFRRFEWPHWTIWLTCSVALFCSVSLRDRVPNVWIVYYLCSLGAAGIILASVKWTFLNHYLTALQRILRFDISYGLYILHFPIMLWIRELTAGSNTVFSAPLLLAVCLSLTAVISLLLMFLIERPAISLGRQLTSCGKKGLSFRSAGPREGGSGVTSPRRAGKVEV